MAIKRAIALAGGGPAVGLSIGTLKRLQEAGIKFDVWTCACIGAWLGVVYNQAPAGQEIKTSTEFFRQIFRPDDHYSRFPIAGVFAPDFQSMLSDTVAFTLNPKNYANLVVPEAIAQATADLLRFAATPREWNFANLNSVFLNDVLAVNPFSRFITSLMFLSATKGLARVFYPDSAFLNAIDFEALKGHDKPYIYYNSYNLTDERLELFTNKPNAKGYGPISAETLCACSALPYIETPVTIRGKTYCEGATIDTVNFEDLLANHPDLDEVWVSRILDRKQVRKPENLYDALNNLIMLFASTTSEDDVKIFKYKLKEIGSKVRVVEIPVNENINYDWTYSNLTRSIADGYRAADGVLAEYGAGAAS
jgi:predicted acylesterase/phospholipase RssA